MLGQNQPREGSAAVLSAVPVVLRPSPVPVAHIVRNSHGEWECFDAHVWAAPHRSKEVELDQVPVEPSTMRLEHLPGYGLCSSKPSAVICIGYPVRRGSPTLRPNP